MITSIIFSKNRPLQLDLTIKSIKQNFPDCSQIIVLHNNDTEFTEAHSILCSEHKDVESWEQSYSIYKDIYAAISESRNKYISFFTDDCICYSPIPRYDYDNLFEGEYGEIVSCFSLRMGLNIEERHHAGNVAEDKVLKYYHNEDDDYIMWSRTLHSFGNYWSYSLSVDGHIFRQKDILEMVDELCYLEKRYEWDQTPNQFEGALQRFWGITQNAMVAFPKSKVVNSPNNRVQDTHENMSGELYSYDDKLLLGKYMSGNRINIDYLDFGEIKCPHTEIDLIKGLDVRSIL